MPCHSRPCRVACFAGHVFPLADHPGGDEGEAPARLLEVHAGAGAGKGPKIEPVGVRRSWPMPKRLALPFRALRGRKTLRLRLWLLADSASCWVVERESTIRSAPTFRVR